MSFDENDKNKIQSLVNGFDAESEKRAVGFNESFSKIIDLKQRQSSSSTVVNENSFSPFFRKYGHTGNYSEVAIKGGTVMDDNKILELYMDKVDKDQRDLKDDVRESEKRTHRRIEESEKRNDERMAQIVELIKEQNQKIEKVEDKLSMVSKEVSNGLNEYRKFMWGITISIFLAIAAMIITVIVA